MNLELYVSPLGQDIWNGFHPDPASSRLDGPIRTVQEGLLRIRRLRQQNRAMGRVTLTLRGGIYRLHEPLCLSPQDSHLLIQAFPGEMPLLSGGTKISSFQESSLRGQRCWIANLDRAMEFIPHPRSLFVNGQHRPRAALPKHDWLRIAGVPDVGENFDLFDGSSRFQVAPGDFHSGWRNPEDIEALISHLWTEERMPFAQWDESTQIFRSSSSSIFTLKNLGWMDSHPYAKYRWENVFEALAEPGEWYLDRKQRTLYYLPLDSEFLSNTEVLLPHLFVRS